MKYLLTTLYTAFRHCAPVSLILTTLPVLTSAIFFFFREDPDSTSPFGFLFFSASFFFFSVRLFSNSAIKSGQSRLASGSHVFSELKTKPFYTHLFNELYHLIKRTVKSHSGFHFTPVTWTPYFCSSYSKGKLKHEISV